MMTASGEVLTQTGASYRERQPERLADYGRAGVPPPLMCYADQIWYRRSLREIVTAVRNSLGLSTETLANRSSGAAIQPAILKPVCRPCPAA